jgi:hypothetical protein
MRQPAHREAHSLTIAAVGRDLMIIQNIFIERVSSDFDSGESE